jgi:hypothetical protein
MVPTFLPCAMPPLLFAFTFHVNDGRGRILESGLNFAVQ